MRIHFEGLTKNDIVNNDKTLIKCVNSPPKRTRGDPNKATTIYRPFPFVCSIMFVKWKPDLSLRRYLARMTQIAEIYHSWTFLLLQEKHVFALAVLC